MAEPTPDPSDWVTSTTGRFVDAVSALRARTTQPVITATRGIVYGIVAIVCGLTVLVLLGIGLFRLLDLLIPGESWSAHLVFGAVCCTLGALLWSRRSPQPPTD